ncbi:MAG: leucine-rich repeat protein [Mediterraneibacter gnavus]
MKKERKKVLLVWVMTLAMLFGVLQPAVGMNEVRAEEGTVSEQNEVGVKYEALPKEPMKTSATASSYQDSAQWGDGNASLAFDGDVNKGWHSQYDSKTGPHWIQWSLGGVHNIGRIAYQVKGTGANGRFKEIKVEVKNGEADWQTVKEETLADVGQGGSCNIDFDAVEATDVKITIKSSYNTYESGVLASAGELEVYKVVQEVPQGTVNAKINGVEVGGESLSDVITKSGVTDEITSIEFVSGTVTSEDLALLKAKEKGIFKTIETFKLNLSDTLKFVDKNGKNSKVLPNSAFYNFWALHTVELGGFEEIGSQAFENTSSLVSVSIPNAVKIQNRAFYNGKKIKELNLDHVKEIETEAFYQCNALTALNVPKVLKIGEKAFYGSKNLKELQLPATLETLGDSAFAVEQKNRRKLNVTSERVTPPVVTPGKNNPFAYAVNSTLTVPAEAREAYVNAERWGDPKNYKWCSLQLEKDMTATDTYYITYHWEDQDNLAGVRPNSVAPTLIDESSASYGADTQYRNVTIQPGPVGQDYQYEFTKVPRYNKRGEPAKWKLNPGSYSTNYEIKTEKTGDYEFKATYTLRTRKQDKTVSVNWVGGDAENRPEIKVQMKRQKWSNTSAYDEGEEITLNMQNNYTHTWENMVEYESGKDKYPYYPIYSIEEIRAVDGYEVTYSVEKNDKDVYPFDETGNIVITCTGEAIPEDVVKVNINKEREAGGTSLEDAVAKAGITADQVTSLEFVSGKVTAGDLEYIQKNVNQIQEFKCNLKNGLTYEDKKGAQSTVFPGWTFSEKASLTTVELGGFTDIGSYAFWKTKNLTSVKIEDAQIIKASAFSGAEKLTEVNIPNVTKISQWGFSKCRNLVTVNMPKVEKIGPGAFLASGYLNITLPASLKSISGAAFGVAESYGQPGEKVEFHVVMEGATPPTVEPEHNENSPFKDAAQTSTLEVPEGSEDTYLKSEFGDEEKGTWCNLPLKGISTDATVTFDVNGTLTTEKIPVGEMIGDKLPENPEKNGFVFTGWNTAKDGSGQEVTDQTVVEGDMTVFAVFDDLKATDTWTLVYHWEDQDNLAGVRPALLTPRLIDESSSAHAADTQGNNVTFSPGPAPQDYVYPFDENGQLVITNTAIDKQAPNVSVKGEGNGDRFRKITGIAVHDTEGVKELKVNNTITVINSKYKYLTDIEKLGVKEGENTAVVTDNAGNAKSVTFYYDTTAPTFNWIVDNKTQAQSKEVRLETSEEIQLPDEGWSLKGEENGVFVYVKTFYANWKDKNFTVTDLAGNVSEPQFVEVKRIDNSRPTVVELTQDITDWTNKDVTVTIKTSTDCVAPEGWKQVNKRTFTKVFNANGEYSVTLTSVTGVTGDAHLFSITNIDKEAPVIDYAAIESANGYRKEIPVNEGEEYTEEKLVEMFTKPEWVSDNSGTATFKVDKWGLEHGLDGYQPFTSKTPGEYKVRFYAYDAAGNNSSFDVYVKVLEPEVEERTTTVSYTVFIDGRVRTGQWTHTGTETGEFRFDLSMVKEDLPASYELEEGEEGYRMLQYGDTTSVTFYLTR